MVAPCSDDDHMATPPRTSDIHRLLERSLAVLRLFPAGVITDFDGTLSPIVPHPETAQPHPLAAQALRLLVRRVELVAVVSGRRALDVATRLDIPELVIVGNHGAEYLVEGQLTIAAEIIPWLPSVQEAARVLRAELCDFLIEEKGATLTIHLRGIDANEQRQRAGKVVEQIATRYGLLVRRGREVLELRPNVPIDKGTAVDALVTRYRLRGVLFAGDDVTDLDAMRYLRERRSAGGIDTTLIGVWSEEAPETLGHLADALVSGVEEFAQFLYAMAQRLSED